jgi:hypothetical protein
MSYRMRRKKSVTKSLRKVAREQIDKAIAEVDDPRLDRHEAVHQVRKRCKKLRGLIRLVRPAFSDYEQENAFIRDAARELSYVRDAQSIIDCFDKLASQTDDPIDNAQETRVREELEWRRREIAEDDEGLHNKLAEFRERMTTLRERTGDWRVADKGGAAISGGLEKTYRRGRKALHAAYEKPSPDAFHEWRKRTKYHWHHLRLLQDIWPEIMSVERDAADRLSDLLGDDHDLAVLRRTLEQEPGKFGGREAIAKLAEIIELRRAQLQAEARPLGDLLYAEKPKRHVARLRRYWEVWRNR